MISITSHFCYKSFEHFDPYPVTTMEYRLPTALSPIHYDLTLFTDLSQHKFRGAVEIDLKVNADTSEIVLNASELELSEVSVTIVGGEDEAFVPISQAIDAINQRAIFVFPKPFAAGSSLKLFIAFVGPLSGNLIGYYEGTWEHDGQKKFYTVTQFEPTAARRAFPCWDEPLLKATFAMSMISASKQQPYGKEDDIHGFLKDASSGDWKITRFDTSPLMSTYIVAYANGQFEFLEGSFTSPLSGKKRPIRVYGTPSSVHQGQYCLEVSEKVLPVYEEVFGIEYPLSKLDTLVIHDMDAYAMENWGLITGRAAAYLLDPKANNVRQKQEIVLMQFHEIAHMWFGNITTMEWWTYLYLNEGFATLMGELIIPDRMFPEWKLDSAFISAHIEHAMKQDNKLSSHPVEVDCPDANKINQIFDGLSYSKAASVLRMLANHVGVEDFLKGVSMYLQAHLYGNSVTGDLWRGVEEATGFNASEFMDAYISKGGFPVITVTESEETIHVTQARFLQKGTVEEADTVWHVPLNLLTVDSQGKASIDKIVLKSRTESYSVNLQQPFKLNAGTFGFYRVLYTPERFRQIAIDAARPNSVFNAGDRLGLVQDAFAACQCTINEAKQRTGSFDGVQRHTRILYLVLYFNALQSLSTAWWENDKVMHLLNEFRRFLFKPIASELGYEYSADENPDISLLRTCAISNLVSARDEELSNVLHCQIQLYTRFKHFHETRDSSLIPEELQGLIYTAAVRSGGEDAYLAIQQIIKDPRTPTEQLAAMQVLLEAMCTAEQTNLILSTIDFMGTQRDQDYTHFVVGLMKNQNAKRLYVEHFKKTYNEIHEKLKDGFSIGQIVESTFIPLTSEKDYKDTKAFFEDGKDTSKYALSVPRVLEFIQEKIAFIENSTDDLLNWLENWKERQ
ncbi:hypothetical protein BT96DRAFT_966398 [Gymnopus androsaceus JB14]|uniref:Aminopeptidase n=1 Tax=Gymnopus androsaceus JB14 TaxID=1447944 RepID=A0A6A4HG11_9AGAR|nr:hypothetical protein BT96DRAFT_966398 [Gymnopus androsaceus JB14]